MRSSLVIPVIIGIIVLALLTSAITINSLHKAARKSHIDAGSEITKHLSRDSILSVLFNNPEQIKSIADSMVDKSETSYAAIYNKTGEVIYQTGIQPTWKPESSIVGKTPLTYEDDLGWHFTANIVIEDAPDSFFGDVKEYISREEIVGFVHTTIPKNIDEEALNKVVYANLTVTAIFIILITALLLLVVNTVTRPIKQLSLFMSKFDGKNLDGQMIEVTGPEEIKEMTAAFNSMVNLIELQNSSLEHYAHHLEETVQSRTKALEESKNIATELNTQNRTLIRGMNDALEGERKFVARELHDHLNALLVAIKLRLNAMMNKDLSALESGDKSKTVEECRDNLGDVISMVTDVYDSSRNIVRMLRPEVIDSLGLVGAIEDTLSTLMKGSPDCTYRLNSEGSYNDLPYNFSIAIYRIAQESLTNAVKHASASRIMVDLSRETAANGNEVINLFIVDNGSGFDVDSNKTEGIGLISMRERAYSLGGEVSIQSGLNKGTTISASIPLPNDDNANQDNSAWSYDI